MLPAERLAGLDEWRGQRPTADRAGARKGDITRGPGFHHSSLLAPPIYDHGDFRPLPGYGRVAGGARPQGSRRRARRGKSVDAPDDVRRTRVGRAGAGRRAPAAERLRPQHRPHVSRGSVAGRAPGDPATTRPPVRLCGRTAAAATAISTITFATLSLGVSGFGFLSQKTQRRKEEV